MIPIIKRCFQEGLMAGKKEVIRRLQELYLYSLYGFSSELAPLAAMLGEGEIPNFFCRGVYDGRRQMLVITNLRVIFIYAPRLSSADVKVVRRDAVEGYSVSRIMFNNSVRFNTQDEVFEMTRVPGKVLDLFTWAMEQPLPARDVKKKRKAEK